MLASKLLPLLSLVFSFLTCASGQQLLVYGTNALPTCAQGCTLLNQAQSACVPPAAPVTNQATYESCFCQSGYLKTLSTSTTGICDTVCGASDLAQIQSWYLSNCKDDGADVAATAATTSATTTAPATTTADVATSAPTNSGSTGESGVTPVTAPEKGSWWSNHWRWVMMVIIIAFGLLAIALIGVLLRRRYHRRQDRITSTFNPGITMRSAPMNTVAATNTNPYAMDGAAAGGRTVPVTQDQYDYTRGDNRQARQTYLPGIREKDRNIVREEPFPALGQGIDLQRGASPADGMERGQSRLKKGKGRMQ
ncbi:hypothetical protein MBLNU459_g0414t1 [Dothideomycetes sp. NU459]